MVRFLFCSVSVIRSCHHRALDPTLTSSRVDEMSRRVLHCIGSLDPLVIQYARTHNKHISSSSSAPTSPSPLFPCLSSLSSLWQMAAKHLNSCPHCHFNSLLSQVFCASHKYLSAVNVMNLIEPQSHPPPLCIPIFNLLSPLLPPSTFVTHLTRTQLARNVEQMKYFSISIADFQHVWIN